MDSRSPRRSTSTWPTTCARSRAELAEKFGGPNKDPKVAGDNLHLNVNEDIKGSRKVSATAAVSMHMFGLAVDMNYTHNPYLLSRGAPPQDVFERAGQLVKGDQLKKREKVSYKFGMYKDINAEYQMVSDANAVIVEYFSLADPANEQQLTDKLDHATGKWKKLDAAAARKLIEKDVVRFAGKLARAGHEEMIRTGRVPRAQRGADQGAEAQLGRVVRRHHALRHAHRRRHRAEDRRPGRRVPGEDEKAGRCSGSRRLAELERVLLPVGDPAVADLGVDLVRGRVGEVGEQHAAAGAACAAPGG